MNLVTVTDPWFGSYILIQGKKVYWAPEPQTPYIVVGPLYIRSFRLERLTNEGGPFTLAGYHENPCQHTIARGTISGSVEPPDEQFGRWYTRLEDGHFVSTLDDSPMMGVDQKLSYTMTVDRSETGVCVSVSVLRELTEDGETTTSEHYSMSFVAKVIPDEYTSAVSYGSWSVGSCAGVSPTEVSVSDATCPYPGAPGDNLGRIYKSLPNIVGELRREARRVPSYKVLRDASIYAALDDLALSNINWVEWAPELVHFMEVIKSLVEVFRGPKNIIGLVKGMANLHLMWKYVAKTNQMAFEDLLFLMRFIVSHWKRIRQAILAARMTGRGRESKVVRDEGGFKTTLTYTTKVVYGPDIRSLDMMIARFGILGFTPRLGDLWDIVPYSFVVDWILPIGDAIYNIENLSDAAKLPLLSYVGTRKALTEVNSSFVSNGHTFDVNLEFVEFTRDVRSDKLPDDVWLGISFQDPRKHSITAAALIVQRAL